MNREAPRDASLIVMISWTKVVYDYLFNFHFINDKAPR